MKHQNDRKNILNRKRKAVNGNGIGNRKVVEIGCKEA